MSKKLLTAVLTLALLPAAAPLRATRATAGARAAQEELTDDEAREALDLARQFAERLRETNDVTPLVEELFVKDLGARLRHGEQLPMVFVAPPVALAATGEMLRRFYVAEFNFFTRTLAYWITLPEGGDGEEDLKLEKRYPPEVMSVLRADPIMSAAIAEAEAEAAGQPHEPGGRSQTEADDAVIKDLAALRTATAVSEQAGEALLAYAPTLSALRLSQGARVSDEDFQEVQEPYLETYEEERYGLPPGTRFIKVNVEPAHDIQFTLVLVRDEGRLRILLAAPAFGD